MVDRLKGKTAIVFGAGSSGPGWGNGKAAAVAYAREGAKVACIDLVREAAQETADIIIGGGRCGAGDRGRRDRHGLGRDAVAEAVAHFGRIDILHNNVGVTHMGGPVELSEAQFEASLDLNIGPIYRTAKAVIPHMLAQGSGAIVNISSLAAIRWTGYPYFAYYATKAAVNQATVALAMQYAPPGHPGQLHHAGPDRHAADLPADLRVNTRPSKTWWPPATRPFRSGAWARPGTSPTRRSSSPPTKRSSSPASACRSMAARAARWANSARSERARR